MRQRPTISSATGAWANASSWLPQPAQRSPQRWAATLFIKRRRSGLLAQFVAVPVSSDGQIEHSQAWEDREALQINLPGGG